MKVVQVGYGYWGANLVKKLLESPKFELTAVCDKMPDRRAEARAAMPGSVTVTDDYAGFLDDLSITGLVIATQTELSFDIGLKAMSAGKHVFMEKPIATTVERTLKLNALAAEKGVVLHCDHILLYNPYYCYIKNMIDSGELGDLVYVDAAKLNWGPIRTDVNALMDLAVHDVAAVDWISNGMVPQKVLAFGHAPAGKQEALTFLNIKYDGFIVHIHSSWLSPVKVRRTVIAGTRKTIVFDDMSDEKVRLYDYGLDMTKEYPGHAFLNRKGGVHIPNIESEDSLRNSLEFFERCVSGGGQSRSGPEPSLRVMRILERAQQELAKMRKDGEYR